MRRIDELHLQWPFMGARMLCDTLRLEGIRVGRRHVATLMREMGIAAVYRRANTSRRHPQNAIDPYLPRKLNIDRPNQVWATDVTYIPMARGFVYPAAVLDWFSRRVLSRRLSNSLGVDFCVEALEEAIARNGAPEILDTDRARGSPRRASSACCRRTRSRSAWTGSGAWRDNVFVKRLWRSVKYEEVHLHAYDSVAEAKSCIENTSRATRADDRTQPLTV